MVAVLMGLTLIGSARVLALNAMRDIAAEKRQ